MTLPRELIQADRSLQSADWSEFRFQPAIVRDDEVYRLPQPVTDFSLLDTWDSERFKTLLVDGDTVVGSTRNGVDLVLRGEIGSSPGETAADAADLFEALAELRDRLHVGLDDARYRLYLIHDEAIGIYRYFQSCSTVRLDTDLTNSTVIRYHLTIHAEDPHIHDEGESP